VSGLSGAWARVGLIAAGLVVVVGAVAAGAAIASGRGSTPASAATQGGASGPPNCAGPKVTVTGTGQVSITPNLLTLSLDVHTTASAANAALSQNNTVTAAVLKALSTGGVASRDLQTTNLTIQPNYGNTVGTVTGYSVDNTVVAKIRKFSTAGTLIDAAVTAGGNATRINGLSFSLTQPLTAQSRARNIAVHQAVTHAKAIATSANEKVRGICSIHDDTTTSTTIPVLPYGAFGAASTPSARVPVEAGSQTVTSRVTIVFALS
jgi:uncharacterized protein YggE